VTPDRGLYTAIVAGFIISLLGGSRVQIGGPTGAFVVIVYGIVQQYGIGGLTAATLMAGVLLVAFGVARLGSAIRFIPHPLITGFTAGIAVIIATGEIKDALGLRMGSVPADFVERISAYRQHLDGINVAALAVCATSIASRSSGVHHCAARLDRVAALGGRVGRYDRRPASLEHGAHCARRGEYRVAIVWRNSGHGCDRAHGDQYQEWWPHSRCRDGACRYGVAHHAVFRTVGGVDPHGDACGDSPRRVVPDE
jgi:hypothetical protein